MGDAAPTPDMPTTLDVMESALFRTAPPVSIGRFQVLRQLGRGGMGIVYLARDPDLKRDVAIKVHRGRGAGVGARIRREGETLARIRHRNVVGVHEVGTTGGGDVFVVMEVLRGPTLRRWCERERPSRARVIDAFVRCARGLQAAHDEGLVHRDFKPDNVIVEPDGEPRIIDFGLARAAEIMHGLPDASEVDERITQEGAVIGTPRYIAPELWDGQRPSDRSDQFSFAVALVECLTGTTPYAARRFESLTRPRGVPRWLWSVLARALAPDPAARWPSMRVIAERLAAPHRPLRTIAIAVAVASATAGGSVLAASAGPRSPSAALPTTIAGPEHNEPCPIGVELLDPAQPWSLPQGAVRRADGALALPLRAGPASRVKARLELPAMSFRDRAVEFEVENLPRAGFGSVVFLGLERTQDELLAALVWGASWVFPMAPNTHGLGMPLDRERDRFFRVQVEDQLHIPDRVSFEVSADREHWTPIARVEGSVASAQIVVHVGSDDAIPHDDTIVIRSVRCTELQPLRPLDAERDQARVEVLLP